MARDLSVIGRALAAPARTAMLNLLMDGSSRPAGDLAGYAGVGASSASEHLAVLLDTGLLTCLSRGRQRFYRITDSDVAAALEQLGHLCPPAPPTSWQRSREARDLADARLCYDHFAGKLGVDLADGLQHQGWIDQDLLPTPSAPAGFTRYSLDLDALRQRRRPISRPCPDWTERRHHVAGSLGAAIATYWIAHDLVLRRAEGRGLELTTAGRQELQHLTTG